MGDHWPTLIARASINYNLIKENVAIQIGWQEATGSWPPKPTNWAELLRLICIGLSLPMTTAYAETEGILR